MRGRSRAPTTTRLQDLESSPNSLGVFDAALAPQMLFLPTRRAMRASFNCMTAHLRRTLPLRLPQAWPRGPSAPPTTIPGCVADVEAPAPAVHGQQRGRPARFLGRGGGGGGRIAATTAQSRSRHKGRALPRRSKAASVRRLRDAKYKRNFCGSMGGTRLMGRWHSGADEAVCTGRTKRDQPRRRELSITLVKRMRDI